MQTCREKKQAPFGQLCCVESKSCVTREWEGRGRFSRPSQHTQDNHSPTTQKHNTQQATPYLNKLPQSFSPDDPVLITDPMLATGGTMLQVLADVVARGASPSNIRVVAVVAAPPALTKIADLYPGLRLYCACIDAEVDERGYIVPGLGDAGDRAFGTA